MFQPQDKVVYPGHGVAVIEDILEKEVGGNKMKFFKLQFLYKDMTVLIPTSAQGTIRRLAGPKEIRKVFVELGKQPKKFETTDFTPSSWNKRNKSYQLKIQSGDIFDIATIYRDLMHTARYKELSFGEKSLLETAEELLIQEVQAIRGTMLEEVLDELRSPFKQFGSFATMDLSSHRPAMV